MTVDLATMTTTAPTAPGRLGDALDPAAIQAYLGELDTWLRVRRSELDELDQAALAAGRGGELAGDMSLALALWKAISDRYQLVFATWDGGRVLQQERDHRLVARLLRQRRLHARAHTHTNARARTHARTHKGARAHTHENTNSKNEHTRAQASHSTCMRE